MQDIVHRPAASQAVPLKHPQLMPQGQNFSLELSLLPIANAERSTRRRAIEYGRLASMVRDDLRAAHFPLELPKSS